MKWHNLIIPICATAAAPVYADIEVKCTDSTCTAAQTCLDGSEPLTAGAYCEISDSIFTGEAEISKISFTASSISDSGSETFNPGTFFRNIVQVSEQTFNYGEAGEGVHVISTQVDDNNSLSRSVAMAFGKYEFDADDSITHNYIETASYQVNSEAESSFEQQPPENYVNLYSVKLNTTDLDVGIHSVSFVSSDSEQVESDQVSVIFPVYPAYPESIATNIVEIVEAHIGQTMPKVGQATQLTHVNEFQGKVKSTSALVLNQLQPITFRSQDTEQNLSDVVVYPIAVLDSDGDLIADVIDAFPNDKTEYLDTDDDGIGNAEDTDDDGDNVADAIDKFPLNRNETIDTDGDGIGDNADEDDDGDGLPDAFEIAHNLDPKTSNIGKDSDSDGVDDITEFTLGLEPDSTDSDSDGLSDGDEVAVGLDPTTADVATIAHQILTPSATVVKLQVQDTASITWQYSTSDQVTELAGLTLRVHYNSTILQWLDTEVALQTGFVSRNIHNDSDNLDGDLTTDKYVEYVWQSDDNTWPGASSSELLTAEFSLIKELDPFAFTSINLTSDNSAQRLDQQELIRYAMQSDSIRVGLGSGEVNASLDINGDGKITLPSDGFIILRHMVGFPAQALATENDLVGATRSKEEMKEYLDKLK